MSGASEVAASRALLREIPDSFDRYHRSRGRSLDSRRARAEHQEYGEALVSAGLQVRWLEAREEYPDCVFIEDTFVLGPGRALMARMACHREGEQEEVRRVLRRSHEILEAPDGARLDGGDVLHLESRTCVGISSRTNEAGAQAVRELLAPTGREVREVPVPIGLHLKSSVTHLGGDVVLAAPGRIDPDLVEASRVIWTHPDECAAANVLRIGVTLLVAAGFPRTLEEVRRFAADRDLRLILTSNREFAPADGGLTCRALIW